MKSRKIIYLCSQRNAKSCLGLHGLIDDGWNVRLVISYVPEKNLGKKRLIYGLIDRLLVKIENVIFGQININLFNFEDCKKICSLFGVPYIATSDGTLESVVEKIVAHQPDIIISNGWMFKISSKVFRLAKIGSVNCHSSFLPDYRGGNITYAPLINEETESGVTVHEISEKFDSGRILAQCKIFMSEKESPRSLNAKRAMVTAPVLIEALKKLGRERSYKDNPPSPFYFRCSYRYYFFARIKNSIRKKTGRPIIKFNPKPRIDI